MSAGKGSKRRPASITAEEFAARWDRVFGRKHPVKKVALCERCGKNPAEEPHTCPYSEEINDNYESLCTCCADCQHECAQEI